MSARDERGNERCNRVVAAQSSADHPEGTKDMADTFGVRARVQGVLDFPNGEALATVFNAFPELSWLTGNVNATPEGLVTNSGAQLLSERVFGAKHTEFDRTAVGVMVLSWVLQGNYEAFTACQPDTAKLSRESFDSVVAYTKRVLPDADAIDAMVTYMVTNDLGKIEKVAEFAESFMGGATVDHDKVLLAVLEAHPDFSPSFERLTPEYKRIIIDGLKAEFNIGQFIQGENVPASLGGLKGLDTRSLDFYLLHALCDIAGAAGHVTQNGSVVMTEDTYRGFRMAIESISKGDATFSAAEVYENYLAQRAEGLGFTIADLRERALTRICCMVRVSDRSKAAEVQGVFDQLPHNTQAILVNELNKTGMNGGFASLLYYSPAVLVNAVAAYRNAKDEDAFAKGLSDGLSALARTYQEGVIATGKRGGSGVFTVMCSELAEATKNPGALAESEITLLPVGDDAKVVVSTKKVLNINSFERLQSLREITGKRIAVIGIGGGSDGVQAAMLAGLLERVGKECPCVISVRTEKTTSQGAGGNIGEARTVQNHGGEISEGVYRVTSESSGSGRFLEHIPAGDNAVFLVIDKQDGRVHSQIEDVLRQVEGVDTIIAVDTGGDALYSVTGQDQAKTTPDQDLRILAALRQVSVPVLACEIACGVDSPENAEEVLRAAGARYYEPSPSEVDWILERYRAWEMDGTNPERFGKTPLAWQAALQGETGYTCLPLPERVVLDAKNPWTPFVHIAPSMRGLLLMELERHLGAIGV